MDITLDAGELYFGLNAATNLETELLNLSNAINGVSVSSELPSAAIFSNLKTALVSTINSEVNDLITRLENSKRILREYDEEAAMLFTFFDNGIINGDFEFTEMPLLDQTDYTNIKYSQGTVATSGCGITSVCMVASYFTGNLYTPEDLAAMANKSASNNVDRMTWAADYVGLKWYCNENTSTNDLKQMLSEGKTVIILVKNSSHFVVCKGITEDGKILVNDPYGPWAKDEPYTLNDLKMSCGKTWVFDPAENQHLNMDMDTSVTVEADVVEMLQEENAFESRESIPGASLVQEDTTASTVVENINTDSKVDTVDSSSTTPINDKNYNTSTSTNTESDTSSNTSVSPNTGSSSKNNTSSNNTSVSTNTGSSSNNNTSSNNTSVNANTGSSSNNNTSSNNTSVNANTGSSSNNNTSSNTSVSTNTGSSSNNNTSSNNTSTSTNTGSSSNNNTSNNTSTSTNTGGSTNNSIIENNNTSINVGIEDNTNVNAETSTNTAVVVPESSSDSNYNAPSTSVETNTVVGTGTNNTNTEIEILDEPIPNTDVVGLSTSPDSSNDYSNIYEEPTERDITVEIPAGSDEVIENTSKKKDFSKYIVPGIAGTAVVGAAVTYGALKNKVGKDLKTKDYDFEEDDEEIDDYSEETEEL
ncbi:MAG: hypothetical protein IJE53_02375 [Bacilli bacterium]|nr:hypothetical protein [Bacilli bacterium]